MNRLLMLISILLISALCLPMAVAQLSGTKTIGGTTPDYATIKAAFQDLSAQGVTTPGVTFLIRGGTYNEDTLIIRTSTASVAAPITIKPDAGATVVINVTPPTTGTPFGIKVDSTAYVTIDGSNNGTTTRDMSITAGSSNMQRGIWVDAQSHHATIKNLNIRAGGITSSYYGIYLFGQTAGNPDNSVVENNLVKNAYYGIRAQGTSATSVNNVIIQNNRVDSVAFYGVYLIYTAYTDLSNNEITVAGGSSTVYAIYLTTNTFHTRVTNNRIHDLTTTSTSAGMYGITSFGTSTFAQNTFFNNFIWGFNPPDAGTNTIYGIYISTANTSIPDTVAFNTVNLTGTSTGNKTTYAFYRASATGPVFLYNNILKNDRTDGTTGVAVAVYKTTAVTVLMSDFNDLYVGTPDARHVTGRITTTNNYITLADWRAANGSDASSVAENPPFVSATDLHIQTTVPTQLESGATPVAGIATDIDGTARSATTPDIGADEFAGIGLDLSPPIISYVPLGPTSATTPRPLTATITDASSGVPRAGIGLPVLYWRINSGTYTGATATWTGGSQYLFTFGGGVVVGDTVSYYIAAQDSAGTPNVGVNPALGAGGLTANPPAAATPPTTPQSYRIVGLPLATGDYTIGLTGFARITGKQLTTRTVTRKVMKEVPVGSEIDYKALATAPTTSLITPFQQTELREVEESYSELMENGRPYEGPTKVMLTDAQRRALGWSDEVLATYPTITAAMADLNLRGVAGSVRFLLNDTSYATETFPITINVIADSVPTASKTVTIKPNVGVTTRISGALASGALLRVIKTDYVTIDGSNATAGTTRDLTLQNTSTTSPQVLVFGSLGTTPIANGTLKNAIVINGINSSTPIIVSDGTTAGNPGYFSNITIQNNVIRNAYHAIYCNAVVAAMNGANLLINSNTIGSTATDSVRFDGVYIQGADGAIVRGNDIGGFSTVTSEVDRGVWLATGTANTLVERNTVHDMRYGGTSGYGGKGIVVSSGLANCNNTIQNNMIYNLTGDGDSYTSFGATYAPNGIYAFGSGQGGVKIYYNTIYLYGNTINNDAQCYSIGIALDDGSAASVVNNLVINNLGLRTNVGVGPVAIAAEVSNAQFTAINYNNYYCNADSPAVDNIGKIAAVDYPTLAGWAAASGGDVNSISSIVNFVSPANLHIVNTTPSPVDSAATPIAGIANDFDGDTRNATRPDIGADEFNIVTLPPPVVSAVARSTRVPMQGDSVVVTCTITDTVGITTANLLYASDGVAQTPVAMTLTGGTPQNGTYRGVLPGSANLNGKRIEYRIQAISGSGNSTTTAVSSNNGYFAGISPLSLSGVKAVGPNRILLYDNYYARVTGTINGPNFQTTNLGYNLQDAVGGINLFKSGTVTPVLALGDSVIVLGRLDQFRGLTEITPDTVSVDIQIVATGRPLAIIDISVPTFFSNPEMYEGRLVRLTTLRRRDATPPWPPLGSSANIIMYQNVVTDTIIMRIDSDTEIDGSPEPAYPVDVKGVITQFTSTSSNYDDGYQTQPRYLTDFQASSPGLSGSYTVGSGGAFPTLDSAFSALRTQGVAGPVTFSLTDSVYRPTKVAGGNGDVMPVIIDATALVDPLDPHASQTAAEPVILDGPDVVSISLTGPIPGASAANRVTIRPATGVRARIVGTGASTFNFLNVSYVTFDGVGTTGATQMSVENTASGGIAFALLGNSDKNILQNMTIRSPYANGICVYADTASGAATDSNQVLNNLMPIGSRGVYLRGGNYVAYGNRIIGNVIGGDSIGALGIYNQQVNGSVIVGNKIMNVLDATTAGGNIAGIWVATKQLNMQIYNNVITGVRNRPGATAAVFASGLYYFGAAGDTSRSKIYNNMVYGLDNKSTSTTSTVRGLYISTSIEDITAYNTVSVTGSDAGTALSSAINIGSAVSLTLRNNIAVNTRTTTGTGRAMAHYALTTTSTYTSNYNDLYVATQTGSHVAGVSTTNYTTLADWQAAGRDSQSVSLEPTFRAPDLHIDSTVYSPINNGGTPIVGITTDIDGQTRNGSTPDIGADEFAGAGPPVQGWVTQTSGVTTALYSVRAVNQNVGWAAGASGRVLRTVNSGNTWTSVGGGRIGTMALYAIEAVDVNTAFVTGTPSTTSYLFRTTNGGTSWDTVYVQAGGFLDAIRMFDANNGIALGDPVGGKWTIIKTTNGGATWVRDTVNVPTQVGTEAGSNNGLFALNPSTIWFPSNSTPPKVYRTTNGGANWLSSTLPYSDTFVAGIAFNTTGYGVVTGNSGNSARSTDGGATWTSVTIGTTGAAYGVAASGLDFFVTKGTNVYRSTDRGATWATSWTGTIATLEHCSFATSGSTMRGWVVGSTGGIGAFYGGLTGVEETVVEIPQTFSLMQNYPNPFNPTTTLRYALPRDARVILSIYNILGQRIATLKDEVQSVGYYDVVWNGRNEFGSQIASGVYFYRIEAKPVDGGDAFTSIKKMLMLK